MCSDACDAIVGKDTITSPKGGTPSVEKALPTTCVALLHSSARCQWYEQDAIRN